MTVRSSFVHAAIAFDVKARGNGEPIPFQIVGQLGNGALLESCGTRAGSVKIDATLKGAFFDTQSCCQAP